MHACGRYGEPIVLDEIALTLGVSIGISVSPDHGDDPEQLIMNADVAMYRAKQSGRLPTAGRDGR